MTNEQAAKQQTSEQAAKQTPEEIDKAKANIAQPTQPGGDAAKLQQK